MNEELKKEAGEELDKHFPEYFDGAYYEKEDTNLGDELKKFIGKYIDKATLAERKRIVSIIHSHKRYHGKNVPESTKVYKDGNNTAVNNILADIEASSEKEALNKIRSEAYADGVNNERKRCAEIAKHWHVTGERVFICRNIEAHNGNKMAWSEKQLKSLTRCPACDSVCYTVAMDVRDSIAQAIEKGEEV